MADETSPDSSTPNPLLMEEVPQTLDEMKQKIAELFHCMVGPPAAYFEIPLCSRCATDGETPNVERLLYSTLSFKVGESQHARQALVGSMLEVFSDAYRQLRVSDRDVAHKPVLFWRREPAFWVDSVPDSPRSVVALRCRVVIPGADLRQWALAEGTGASPL